MVGGILTVSASRPQVAEDLENSIFGREEFEIAKYKNETVDI